MKKESFTSFMKQVAADLQQSGNLGTAHVYRSSLNAILVFQESESVEFREITPEWLKHFEGSLRARGCSWNTVSTYLRTMRAVYNRAVDLHRAPYVPHLFRSVYTGTRADRRRALDMEDMKKVFARLLQSAAIPPGMRGAQELFILMFLLRGLPFVDLAYLRKSDLRGDVITYRRRKTGRPLSVTLTPEAMFLLQKYMNRVSGPLLDRIDIQVEIVPVPFEKISEQRPSESSADVRERVIKARSVQEKRFAGHEGIYCNAQMSTQLLHTYAVPDAAGLALLKTAMQRLSLSARAYDRILKVSRTIADLDGSEKIEARHLAEAINYRNLDRESWGL